MIRFERPNREQAQRLIQLKLSAIRVPETAIRAAAEQVDGMTHADIERVCIDTLKKVALGMRKSIAEADLVEAIDRQRVRRQVLDSSLRQKPGAAP